MDDEGTWTKEPFFKPDTARPSISIIITTIIAIYKHIESKNFGNLRFHRLQASPSTPAFCPKIHKPHGTPDPRRLFASFSDPLRPCKAT
jgi:hypothetical protein